MRPQSGVEARARQEGGLAAMSQLGLDPSVDEEGENCDGGGHWWCDAIRHLLWRMHLEGARLEADRYSSSPGERMGAEPGQE